MNLKIQNIRDVSCFVITGLYELWSHGWGLSLFWDVTLLELVFSYRRFAITCRTIFNVQAVILLVLLRNLEMGPTGWTERSVSKYQLTRPSWTSTTSRGGPKRRKAILFHLKTWATGCLFSWILQVYCLLHNIHHWTSCLESCVKSLPPSFTVVRPIWILSFYLFGKVSIKCIQTTACRLVLCGSRVHL